LLDGNDSILQLLLARDAEQALVVTRVMSKLRNHKLLTFVFVIQPLLWLQGIDRLNGLIIILRVAEVFGKRVVAYLWWFCATSGKKQRQCWCSAHVGREERQAQKTRCRDLV